MNSGTYRIRAAAVLTAGWALLGAGLARAQAPGGEEPIPPLKPPRGELPPTFWEQHGTAVLGGGVALLVVLVGAAVLVWWWLRRRAATLTPEEAALRELRPLRGEPETGATLTKVSQTLRRYFVSAFGLSPGEATTAEFCQELQVNNKIGPALGAELTDFLRQCDEYKFAPPVPRVPLRAVDRSLEFLDKARARRAALEAEAAGRQA